MQDDSTIESAAENPDDTRLQKRTPIDLESFFDIDELFFSTTDKSGRIISGNRVFERVSKFSYDELISQAHNIIRHPDMPRCVFRVLWDHLNAGEAVAAYVKNMAKDGSWYWVFAYVVPVDNEYLSVRLQPSSALFETVQSLYKELRETELAIESRDITASWKELREEAITASTGLLQRRLRELHIPDYDTFMRSAITVEVISRDEIMKQRGISLASRFTGMRHSESEIPGKVHWATLAQTYESIRQLFDTYISYVTYFEKCDSMLGSKTSFLEGLAESIRIFSLNAILACDAIPSGAETLTAVASLMRDRSNVISGMVTELTSGLSRFSRAREQIGFCISSGRMQTDLATQYVNGVFYSNEVEHDLTRNLTMLATSESSINGKIQQYLQDLLDASHHISKYAKSILRELGVLQVLHMNGRVESASVSNNGAIVELFHNIGEQVRSAQLEMEQFAIVNEFFALEKIQREAKLETRLQELQLATRDVVNAAYA